MLALLIAATLAFAAPPAQATTAPAAGDAARARTFLQRLEQHHARTADLIARFTQSYRSGMLGREVTERGIVSIKRPGRMRWEYKDPEPKLFVSDGKTFYFYVPADKQVIVSEQDEQRSLAARLLSGRGGLAEEFLASLESPLEEGVVRLKLVPRREQPDVERAFVDVEPSGRVRSILLDDVQGNRTRFRFEGVRENTRPRGRAVPLRGAQGGRGDPRMRRLLLLVALLAAGCATSGAFRAGERAERIQDYDRAVLEYRRALKEAPENVGYKRALARARLRAAHRPHERRAPAHRPRALQGGAGRVPDRARAAAERARRRSRRSASSRSARSAAPTSCSRRAPAPASGRCPGSTSAPTRSSRSASSSAARACARRTSRSAARRASTSPSTRPSRTRP